MYTSAIDEEQESPDVFQYRFSHKNGPLSNPHTTQHIIDQSHMSDSVITTQLQLNITYAKEYTKPTQMRATNKCAIFIATTNNYINLNIVIAIMNKLFMCN